MLRDLHKPSAPMKAALSSCRRHFLSSLIFSALMNVLYIGPVLYMLQIYDRVVTGQGRLTLFFLTVIIIFAIGTLALLEQVRRSEEHTSELQSLMRISYAVFCLKKKKIHTHTKKTAQV